MYVVVVPGERGITLQTVDDDGRKLGEARPTAEAEFAATVAAREATDHPRWVWNDSSVTYRRLLDEHVRVERCVDLRLSHAILRGSELSAASALAKSEPSSWDRMLPDADLPAGGHAALFEFEPKVEGDFDEDPLEEFALQRDAVRTAREPARLGLLLAAESAGALVAAEMFHAGLPWRADEHDRILASYLGPRPRAGERPERLKAVLEELRAILDAPDLNPDSPPDLLKSLRRAGLLVTSTRSYELKLLDHPAIAPLLEYKKLARLLSANGWHWLDTNVRDGRFHPDYVPGGVVTGRWASKGGGGALQLPKQIRGAVIADPGWSFVVADASQLEPRILAGLAGDRDMAAAGAAGDLYAGIVASGAVETRDQAKVAMLGAMYGATTGESGRLMPKLQRAYPRAIGLVEAAARTGERGDIVTTRLGRSSPRPSDDWRETQAEAYGDDATDADTSRARRRARDWGRFTRNFVVQGSAAEWALCWMADLRGRLHELGADRTDGGVEHTWITDEPHLVFFMHDEVVIHCPTERAEAVADAVRDAAASAGRLLFGDAEITFPLTVVIVESYGDAK